MRLEGERAELALRCDDERIMDLTPDLPTHYGRQVEELAEQVKSPDFLPKATAILRDLIERVILHPAEARGEFKVEIQGHLAGLIRFAAGKPPSRSALVLNQG